MKNNNNIQEISTKSSASLANNPGEGSIENQKESHFKSATETVIIYSDVPSIPDYQKYGLGKHFMCVGQTGEGLLVFEKVVKSKYDAYEYTQRHLADTKDFNYWGSANDSDWAQTHIWPSRDPDSDYKPIFKEYTYEDGTISRVITNHDTFFSRESLCMFEKYGEWPITNLDYIPKDEVSIIAITILRPKPAITILSDIENPREWGYIKESKDVAIYTGEIVGPSRYFTIKHVMKTEGSNL